MHQVSQGNVARLGLLFERHHARLFNFCLRLTGSPQTSEDLVQEVFYRILKYRHTYRPQSDFLVWTYQMARNAAADHYRKHQRLVTGGDEAAAETAAGEPLALGELESAEALDLLGRALERLPLAQRELLVLARFRHLDYQQIAELLDTTVGAVKVRVHRAVKQLRDVYRQLATGPATEVTS